MQISQEALNIEGFQKHLGLLSIRKLVDHLILALGNGYRNLVLFPDATDKSADAVKYRFL